MYFRDQILVNSDYVTIAAQFAVYCSLSTCQTIIRPGTPVKKYDGATFTHVTCPKTPHKTFAPHKVTN